MVEFFNFLLNMPLFNILQWLMWFVSFIYAACCMFIQCRFSFSSKSSSVKSHVHEHFFIMTLLGSFQILIIFNELLLYNFEFFNKGWLGFIFLFVTIINFVLSKHLLIEVLDEKR
jgi:hypothetical protein